MPFTTPVFNLLCDIYSAGSPPPVGPPILTAVPCQYYIDARSMNFIEGVARSVRIPSNFPGVIPSGTPFIGDLVKFTTGYGSIVVGISFWILERTTNHDGFPNEYISLLVAPTLDAFLPAFQAPLSAW
jgi:hypothetical protein